MIAILCLGCVCSSNNKLLLDPNLLSARLYFKRLQEILYSREALFCHSALCYTEFVVMGDRANHLTGDVQILQT